MKNPFRFKYDLRSMTCGAGATWWCQRPGKRWDTGPDTAEAGYRLDYRRFNAQDNDLPTGWYLTGPAVAIRGEYAGATLPEAVATAAVYLPGKGNDE